MKVENTSNGTASSVTSQQQVIRENLQALVRQLEAGHSEALTAFLNAMGAFRHYSFGNVLMIATQKPEATRVAGIVAWNQLSRRVKRGERGIAILAPMIVRRDDEKNTNELEESTKSTVIGFRRVYVWDIS
jgi:hypothetical protein